MIEIQFFVDEELVPENEIMLNWCYPQIKKNAQGKNTKAQRLKVN